MRWEQLSMTVLRTGASGTLERVIDGGVHIGTVTGTIQGTLKMN